MYHYHFQDNNEVLLKESLNINIKIEKRYYQVSFVLTDKNLLIFYDLNKDNVLKGRVVQVLPEYELLWKIPLEDLTYKIEDDHLLILINNQKIDCYDFDIEEFLKK